MLESSDGGNRKSEIGRRDPEVGCREWRVESREEGVESRGLLTGRDGETGQESKTERRGDGQRIFQCSADCPVLQFSGSPIRK